MSTASSTVAARDLWVTRPPYGLATLRVVWLDMLNSAVAVFPQRGRSARCSGSVGKPVEGVWHTIVVAMRKDALVTRSGGAVALGLLGALLVGGVSQAFLWRWGLGGLSDVLGSQFMWVLLIFGVAWGWAEGRVGQGAAAGGVTGLALIVSYYAMQWVADGRHSAVAQFSKTGGVAWTLAAMGGGAVIGLFGALASLDGRDRPRWKALGVATPAVIVGAGPVLWILTNGRYLEPSRLLSALVVFVLAGGGLLVYAVRTCGAIASLRASAVSVGLGAAALVGLLWLQTHGWLYLTF